MHVAIRELALLAVVLAGTAEAFAPAPSGLALRGTSRSVVTSYEPQRLVSANGVTSLKAVVNGDKIGKIVPRNLKEGVDYVKATKVGTKPCVNCARQLLFWHNSLPALATSNIARLLETSSGEEIAVALAQRKVPCYHF
jgi:hypothetical protein